MLAACKDLLLFPLSDKLLGTDAFDKSSVGRGGTVVAVVEGAGSAAWTWSLRRLAALACGMPSPATAANATATAKPAQSARAKDRPSEKFRRRTKRPAP